MTKIYEDLSGRKFGKLLVINRNYEVKNGKRNWNCLCECGNTRVVTTGALNGGKMQKCRKCSKESRIEYLKKMPRKGHGMTKTKIWKTWRAMRERCYVPCVGGYKNYGGRGIKVCDEWNASFENFMEWAYANGYKENLSLDRIDVNGNYEPNNCRWVTFLEQANNKRTSHFLEYNGEIKTITEWSRITGINKNTLLSRVTKYGWSVERALNTKTN